MAAPAVAEGTPGDALDADAFQRLYPDAYYAEFLKQGVRPDGRTFDQARDTTLAVDVVSTADASALIRLGASSAIAGAKLEVPLWLHLLQSLCWQALTLRPAAAVQPAAGQAY